MKKLNKGNLVATIFFLISLHYVLAYYFLPNGTDMIEIWWVFLIIDTFVLAKRVNDTVERKQKERKGNER